MQALAAALQDRDAPCELLALNGPVSADILVVDSYLHRADDATVFSARRVAAVDDLGRDLAVDLLIDPIGAPAAVPARTAACRVLAGLCYALVGPAAVPGPGSPDPTASLPPPEVREVLVTTGGSDTEGQGARMAAALVPALPGVAIRLVTGPWGSTQVPAGVERVDGSAGIAGELARAGLVVTAGGVTMLEAMALGRPVIAVVTAENQRRYVESAARQGGVAASTAAGIAEAAQALLADPQGRRLMAATARKLIDGHGPDRVAEAILALR